MTSRSTISDELATIEQVHGVRVVFACESGSRAWGFASEDSDFDVRFVYVRPITDYLSLETPRDVIEHAVEAENSPIGVELDMVGWDLAKFMRLLHGSNPSAIEWLGSTTVYRKESRFSEVEGLRDRCFDPPASAWHYYGMAKKHDLRYLNGDLVSAKKYLYIIRAILAAKWSISRFSPAPMPFEELVNAILLPELRPAVENLLERKLSGKENGLAGHDSGLDNWIFANLEALPDEIRQIRHRERVDWAELDGIYRSLLWI